MDWEVCNPDAAFTKRLFRRLFDIGQFRFEDHYGSYQMAYYDGEYSCTVFPTDHGLDVRLYSGYARDRFQITLPIEKAVDLADREMFPARIKHAMTITTLCMWE